MPSEHSATGHPPTKAMVSEQQSPSLVGLLVVLVPAMLLIPVASDMVSLVLPEISAEFTASTGQAAWVVTGFLLACAIGVPLYGRMADRVSLRRLFITALAVYAAGSLLCAIAPFLPLLVAGRVIAGAGGAAIPVLTIVAASRLLPAHQTALGIGFIAAAGGAGTALGPAIGGGLGQWLGWRALFWLMTIAAIALIPATARTITSTRPAANGRLDLLGGILLGGGVGLALFGITRAEGTDGFAAPASWISLLAGAILLAGVIVRSRTATDPFVPPTLFTHRGYLAATAVIFLAMLVNLTALVLVPLLVIEVNGLTPAEGSLVMIPGGIALALVSTLAGRISPKGTNERTLTLSGITAITAAMLLLSTTAGATPWLATLAVTILGAGFGLVVTLTTNAVSQLLPPHLVGSGIGIFQSAQFLGAGTGPALFGVLLTLRTGSNAGPINPLAHANAAAYSDVFLILSLIALIALAPAFRLLNARKQPAMTL